MKNKIIILIIIINVFLLTLSPLSVLAADSSGGGDGGGYTSVRCETDSGVVYYYPNYQIGDIFVSEPAIFKMQTGYTLVYFKANRSYYIDKNGKILGAGQGFLSKWFATLEDIEYELFEKGVGNTFSGYEELTVNYVYQTVMISENVIDGDSGEYTGPNGDTSIVKKSLTEYYNEWKKSHPDEDLVPMEQGKYIICEYLQTILKDQGKDNPMEYGYALIKVPDACEEVNFLNEAEKFDLMFEDWFANSTIMWSNYAIATHGIFDVEYDRSQKFRIYYFDSLKDAVMYQLYGIYPKDENGYPQALTFDEDNYAVNITEWLYSNVQVGEFYHPIDEDNYSYEENYIVLKQISSQTYFKIYYDYRPYINTIIKDKDGHYRFTLADKRFTWSSIYTGTFDDEGNPTTETISADGWDPLTEDDKYYWNRKDWYLYSPNVENQIENEILHQIIFSTNETKLLDFYIDEDGKLTGGMSDDQILHNVFDKDGNRLTYNELTNEYVKEDEFYDPYKDPDGDGIYENSKGDKLDPSTLTDATQDRLDNDTLDAGLNGIVGVFHEFSVLIKKYTVQMDQAGKLVNGTINQIPYEVIALIGLSMVTIIIVRFVRQRE